MARTSDLHGLLNLNKSAGFTSHDCVAKVRRLLQTRRVGHGGTLDPAATGVLPIALGKATRLLPYLRSDKAYRAVIRLGVQTTTDDLEGEILDQCSAAQLDVGTVTLALQAFVGHLQQIPPAYSAVQVDGQRLYDLARSGQSIKAKPRPVQVFDLDVLDWRPGEQPELEVTIACGPGTYIRAIARDLGAVLGVGGTLAELLRTRSCGFELGESLTLEQLATQVEAGQFQPVEPAIALTHLPELNLPPDLAKRWCQGQRLLLETTHSVIKGLPVDAAPPLLRIHTERSEFLGISKLEPVPEGYLLRPQLVYTVTPP